MKNQQHLVEILGGLEAADNMIMATGGAKIPNIIIGPVANSRAPRPTSRSEELFLRASPAIN
jgi:hypothetical protein